MASTTIMRLRQQNKTFSLLGFISLLLLIQKSDATEFKVGGANGWTVPTDPNAPHYNQWAEGNRFQIGDSLLFVYPADKDSVLRVSKDEYTNCDTATYIDKFSDGKTVFKFNQSGPFYFISGVEENCLKNEKMMVVVMADRSKRNQTTTAASPSPSESRDIVPIPAPAGDLAPSPPPSGTLEIVPSAPPTSDQSHPPPPSGTSSIIIGLPGSFGAFISSYLLLLF